MRYLILALPLVLGGCEAIGALFQAAGSASDAATGRLAYIGKADATFGGGGSFILDLTTPPIMTGKLGNPASYVEEGPLPVQIPLPPAAPPADHKEIITQLLVSPDATTVLTLSFHDAFIPGGAAQALIWPNGVTNFRRRWTISAARADGSEAENLMTLGRFGNSATGTPVQEVLKQVCSYEGVLKPAIEAGTLNNPPPTNYDGLGFAYLDGSFQPQVSFSERGAYFTGPQTLMIPFRTVIAWSPTPNSSGEKIVLRTAHNPQSDPIVELEGTFFLAVDLSTLGNGIFEAPQNMSCVYIEKGQPWPISTVNPDAVRTRKSRIKFSYNRTNGTYSTLFLPANELIGDAASETIIIDQNKPDGTCCISGEVRFFGTNDPVAPNGFYMADVVYPQPSLQ